MSNYDPAELDRLNTKLCKLDSILRDVQNEINLIKYQRMGGDESDEKANGINVDGAHGIRAGLPYAG